MFEQEHKTFSAQFTIRFDFVKLSGCQGGFELCNQIHHCKTVCIKRNLYLINYNRMSTQLTTKANQDAGTSCLCDRGLRRYLRNFGGSLNTPNPPSRYATVELSQRVTVPYVACVQLYPPEDEHLRLETCRGEYYFMNK